MQSTFTHTFNMFLSLGVFVYFFAILFVIIMRKNLAPVLKKYTLWAVFGISTISMIGSLLYAYVSDYAPCDLCWYQRIFLYALSFVTGLALIKKDTLALLKPYLLLLTVVGGIISIVHNVIYYVGYNPLPCSATASCTARYVFEFGFITIPLMALVSFAFIFVLLVLTPKKQ